MMKAVILAAGEGKRMRPLTYARPKAMLRIINIPIIEHIISACKTAGISDFILVVGYRDEQVRNYFSDGRNWGVNIEYRLQRYPKGTADAIGKVRDLISDCFLVINGDVLTSPEDLSELIKLNGFVLSGKEVDNLSGLGAVEVAEEK
jgi:bifunctional UDP-N-acetylglucosamine pyrophosphorylase/glucosamine-1-phosphate N-acetyltransferase